MFWQRPFMHGVSGDGWVPVQELTATFTVDDLGGWLVDENAINDPRRTPGRPEPREAARIDVVSCGLRVISDRLGDSVVVRAIGAVDARSAEVLASALRAGWVAARRPGLLVVDLSGVVFCSVAGLELLITTEQHCRDSDLPLRLVATHGVLRALRTTGLDVLFDITTPARASRPRANPDWTLRN
jgi:anti-anti-sigma factor